MIGAIAGDIIGSRYEGSRAKVADFPLFLRSSRFTDDTVCSLAVANAIMVDGNFAKHLRRLCRCYPDAGYGGMFRRWFAVDDEPAYGSWGNGAPMRVSAVGWLARSIDEVDTLAEAQASVSHSHPDAIIASRAVARAIFLLSQGKETADVEESISKECSYDLSAGAIGTRPRFDITAKGTAQTGLSIALRSSSYEAAIRDVVLLGGDTDTLACVAGSVAEAIHGVPQEIAIKAKRRLPPDLLAILKEFDLRRNIERKASDRTPGRGGNLRKAAKQ
ncbi:ADP-ribosylglycohydrolase family protein [Aestuariivirga sp.]|uniref:ADP-ribosylglycohydrolase family protein n=1 Tax=Aestuariivirga sp. TaxID=2650926 RepID=UPI003784D638